MKILALTALAASLALAGCDNAPDTAAEDGMTADSTTADTADATMAPPPAPTETVIVDDSDMGPDADVTVDGEGIDASVDGEDVDATVSEDGVTVDID